ncbi:MAG: dihydrodipicolinate synthase family protein [Chloroflexi bacterium]|nr:dihydrodipicolinate synthase family protein [Chloroflexota bacterium]MBV9595706.1 dihydrodipicolinate synthase family protein [Chloroflexota bacterium]
MITATRLNLPRTDGSLEAYDLGGPSPWPTRAAPPRARLAFAAAHVVADPLAAAEPWLEPAVDWDSTLAFRRHLWDLGMSIAEAMDTAQRGMGLDWSTSEELIRRSLAEARALGAEVRIACGAGTDQLEPGTYSLDRIVEAYLEQCEVVESQGGRVILMASRALAASVQSADGYAQVYARVLGQLSQPAIIHWLGDMFDPALAGYWGSTDLDTATRTCLDVLAANASHVDGIKISLLDKQREIDLRRQLPAGVRMYTGDDFNYPELILGDELGASDALLGIFDAIAPAAAAALAALDAGERAAYLEILEPTVALSRQIFRAPTRFYKTGVVFLAYLNGHQNHFRMIGGQESARSILDLCEVFRLADKARLLRDPELAGRRMRQVLALAGVDP